MKVKNMTAQSDEREQGEGNPKYEGRKYEGDFFAPKFHFSHNFCKKTRNFRNTGGRDPAAPSSIL